MSNIWNRIDNNFFHITYSTKTWWKPTIRFLWKGRIYILRLNVQLETVDLVNDGVYPNVYTRIRKQEG